MVVKVFDSLGFYFGVDFYVGRFGRVVGVVVGKGEGGSCYEGNGYDVGEYVCGYCVVLLWKVKVVKFGSDGIGCGGEEEDGVCEWLMIFVLDEEFKYFFEWWIFFIL